MDKQHSTFFNSHLAFTSHGLIDYGSPPEPKEAGFSKTLKNKLWFMLSGAEVAQIGRALDSTTSTVEGEAEDRVVASSSPALGTTSFLTKKK